MQPTALHWTSTFGESIWRISGSSPPSLTIVTLFSAVQTTASDRCQSLPVATLTVDAQVAESGRGSALDLDVVGLQQEQDGLERFA